MISKHIKEYCKDDLSKIENYNKAVDDTEHLWVCHHRLELTLEGEYAHSQEELKRFGMYYKRPYFELIFLTPSEHNKLHGGTQYARQKNSESQKGKKLSEETKQKISKLKKNNKSAKGKIHSEFGKKFKEHFGITRCDNIKLYNKEKSWYQRNRKCRWE